MTNIKVINANNTRTSSTNASGNSIARNNRGYHAPWGPRGPKGPEGPLGTPRAPKGPLGPPRGPEGAPGSLGPEALRAGGLGKHGLAITRSVLERHGLSKGCGLAVCGEAVRG